MKWEIFWHVDKVIENIIYISRVLNAIKWSSENATCDNDISNQNPLSQLGVCEDKSRNKEALLGWMMI